MTDFTVITGCIVFVVALCGASLNVLVLRFTKRAKAFQSCFGNLVRFEAGSALVFNCIFGFYVAPTLIFDISPLRLKSVSARFGHLAVLSHDVCLLTHLTISINRFIAAWMSSKYNRLFTTRKTVIYSVLIVIIAFLITLFHFIEPCWIYFDFSHVSFTYEMSRPDSCGSIVAFYVQFPRNLAVMCVCTLLNVATYGKIRLLNQSTMIAVTATMEQQRRHKIELALISQVCVQAAVYIIQFFTYFIIAPHIANVWVVFLLTTFAWEMIHVTDGLAVFAFNRELLNIVLSRIRPGTTVTHSLSSRPISTSMKL